MTEQEFAEWLVEHGYAEAHRGHGHATGEDIAEALYSSGYFITGGREMKHPPLNWEDDDGCPND